MTEFIRLCARLSLALAITAAPAAARPDKPLAALTAELRAGDTPLDALDGGDQTANVRYVFSWSYRQLSPPAARVCAAGWKPLAASWEGSGGESAVA